MVGCLFCLLFFLMYPDILISSFFGVLFPVIQLFCDLFFLFFTLNVPRNLHFFIYWGISFFHKNFMLYFIVLFCQFRTPKFSIFVILGYITTTNAIFRLVCGVFLCVLILCITFYYVSICKTPQHPFIYALVVVKAILIHFLCGILFNFFPFIRHNIRT